MYYKPMQ